MRINVNDLRQQPLELDVDASAESFHLAAEGFTFPAPVTGHVRFQMVSQRILANGNLETRTGTACVRCLAPIEAPISAKIELVFEKRPSVAPDDKDAKLAADWDADAREIDYYGEEELDPTEPFRQLLTLELPNYPLCRDDCRGLCPTCGVNLNHGACQCGVSDSAFGESDWKTSLKEIHLD